ncbi:MAG: ankyrin repeat domain-containing protein [Pirellulaceae bacterium]
MRYKTTCSLQAQLVDHDGTNVSSDELARKLDGLACHSDSVLNYAELAFADACALRGGYPRLALDEKGRLLMAVEIDSQRKLTRKELGELREDVVGQLTDGIGTGCFDELTTSTGLGVQLRFPVKPNCTQTEGTAWRPKATTERGNKQRIATAAKLIKKADSIPNKSPASRVAVAGGAGTAASPGKRNQPNFQKLFRLLAKPERDQLFDQIKAELEECGNDLSGVGDREYPYGNLSDPKLLRLLLNAGLPPETTDVKGNSLLVQAAVNPKCIELMLKHGADVNRVCDSHVATTALIRAANLGKRKSVEILLEHGADPSIKDKSGKAAWDVVDKRSRERQAIVDLLQSRSPNKSKA